MPEEGEEEEEEGAECLKLTLSVSVYLLELVQKKKSKGNRKQILSTISSAITGESKKDRSSLFLLGKSSAGKSLLMQTLNRRFFLVLQLPTPLLRKLSA